MVYTTPRPDDDERLAAWRRRQAKDAVRSINIRLPLAPARRGGRAGCPRLAAGRYVGDLLRAALGEIPRVPPPRLCPPAPGARARRSGPGEPPRPAHHPVPRGPRRRT